MIKKRSISKTKVWLIGILCTAVVCVGLCLAGSALNTVQNELPTQTPTLTDLPSVTPAVTFLATMAQTVYRPVTWMQLVSFIEQDHTNWNQYGPNYVCLDFAIDLVASATKENIKAWIVGVSFVDQSTGHAFTAFPTTDRGIVFIEPQTDVPYIEPKVGQPLCDAWTGVNCLGTISEIDYLQCDHRQGCTPYKP